MKTSVNAPRTPVTKGSNGVAAATVPNVCKMPGPPAPFVPTPLPNIGRSGLSPKGYSKKVKIEGKNVAIGSATFGSQGDAASKGTGGGLVSANTHGPTRFVSPGSLDVSFEGKPVHLLGDMMLNNCGPSGSPPNAATMAGLLQAAKGKNPRNDDLCGAGKHNEVIEFPEVPPGEEDPQARVASMQQLPLDAGVRFEIEAALHNIADGSISHGKQISRPLTAREEAEGHDRDEQLIFAICQTCGFRREIDHASGTSSAVEVKQSSKAIRGGSQMDNNAGFVARGGSVTYKSPALSKQKLAWVLSRGFSHVAI